MGQLTGHFPEAGATVVTQELSMTAEIWAGGQERGGPKIRAYKEMNQSCAFLSNRCEENPQQFIYLMKQDLTNPRFQRQTKTFYSAQLRAGSR